jgi:hypothetical protein
VGFGHLKGNRVSIHAEKGLALALTSYASSVADVATHFVLRILGYLQKQAAASGIFPEAKWPGPRSKPDTKKGTP